MKPIDDLREEIRSLEQRLNTLRAAVAALASAEGRQTTARPQDSQKTGKTRAASVDSTTERPASVGALVLGMLKAQGAMNRADIETAVLAEREVTKASVGMALQRLRSSGKVLLQNNQWKAKRR